ncbi:MAG: insulinase family protein [Bacteroidales bacterium]|nr:insulinase family protein [Bacteroidales bacterium]MCF8328547.1 insulinase family protein [Bacteroidales bacterium]
MEVNRSIAPEIHQIRSVKPLEFDMFKMYRDTPVYYTEGRESNLFKLVIRINGGIAAEKKPLQAQLLAKMLLQGTKSKNSDQIAQIIDFYGASLMPVVEHDFISIKLTGLKKDFQPLVELVGDIIHNPMFPEKEFKQQVNKMRAQFKTNIQKRAYEAQNEMKPLLFGVNHPYGHKTDNNTFHQIDVEDIREYYQDVVPRGYMRIFVSGITRDKAQKSLGKITDSLKGEAVQHFTKAEIPENERKEFHVYHKNAVQSAIRLGWKTGNRNHEDFIELKILNTLLGGYFGSRLMKNLREEKGFTYGIGSAIVSTQQTGMWLIATEVGAEYTKQALEEIYKEVEVLKKSAVGEEEINLIKNYLPGKIIRSLEKDFDKLDSFVELSDHGLPADYYSLFLEKIRNIDSDRIKELADKYLTFDRITEVVSGKL